MAKLYAKASTLTLVIDTRITYHPKMELRRINEKLSYPMNFGEYQVCANEVH